MNGMEQWRTIAEFPYYEVSNYGVIRRIAHYKDDGSLLRQRVLKQIQTGYVLRVNFHSRQSRRVDRLVATAFLPNPNGYRFIYHKDGNTTNNRADNLEWCSYNRDLQRRRHYGTAIR